MKNSLKYMQLWQAKRSALKLIDDPQAGWMEMQGLLDKHLPVTHHGGKGGSSAGTSSLKLQSFLLVGLSAAVVIYFLAHNSKTNDHRTHQDSLTEIRKTKVTTDGLKIPRYKAHPQI